MPQNHVEIKNFAGLYLQQNTFTVPDGALEDALNAVITFNGVITARRGLFEFHNPGASVLNNLFLFQDVLLAIYTDKMEWLDGSGTATTLNGAPISEIAPRVSRDVQSNDNLYFTSDNGVMKLEQYNGHLYKAGVPPALDLRAQFALANGPIGDDTEVAWRVVFGRMDSNKNELLSSPSDITVLTNRPKTAVNYVSNPSGGGFLVTVDTVTPHNLVDNMTVDVSNATGPSADGTQTITVTDATHFTFTTTVDPTSGTLDYGVSRAVILEASVPDEIDSTEYFIQIYRTSQSASADATPEVDFKLIDQRQLTTEEITDHVVYYTDTILDIFAGAELYTNPNSQEGELQANERPPLCEDVAFFKNYVFYANTTSRQILNFSLVTSSSVFINEDDFIETQQGSIVRRYVARLGVGNALTKAAAVSGTTVITITSISNGLRNNDIVNISNVVGTIDPGDYTVTVVDADNFQIMVTAGETATALYFEGVSDANGYDIFQLLPPGSSPATGIDSTARGIVKAINRDTQATVYAKYLSGITDIPGKMLLQSMGFTLGPIQVRANTTQVGQAFSPDMPDTFNGTYISTDDALPNNIYSSKVGEPEAVPIVNTFPIGTRNQAILRIFALRDAVIILKADGVYRLDGDRPSNFTSTIVDSTVICLSPSSAKVINNQVVFLSNQGVSMVSGSSVNIISRKIEAPIAAVLGNTDLNLYTSAVAYESERLYLLTTMSPNTSGPSVVYCYNTLTDSWSTWDTYFRQGIIGPQNKLFLITEGNVIAKERKNQNKLDYCDQDYPATVVSVGPDLLSAIVNFGVVVPEIGDILVINNTISRIRAVEVDGINYDVTFELPTTLLAGDTPTLYSAFYIKIRMAPFHAGMVERAKQFSQMQIHTKDSSISVLDITYATESYGSSEITHWRSADVVSGGGWGLSPWGFFPWGLDSGINLTYSTQPAPPIRIYVPLFSQRCTFIQAILEHKAAGEPLNIQALGFTLRGYGERVSK